MKSSGLVLPAFASVVLSSLSPPAVDAETQARLRILRPTQAAASYSVEVPIVTRVAPVGGSADTTLVLNSNHSFNITLSARDQRTGGTGPGIALPQNDIFGYFSIPALTFNSSNPEVFVKIIDGTSFNGFYWVFYGGLTDLEYTLTVRENSTGRAKTYTKPAGGKCGDFDTQAFSLSGSVSASAEASEELLAQADAPPNVFLRTSIDISNNTSKNGVVAEFQYSYTCTSSACSPPNRFSRTQVRSVTLQGLDSFHQDDIVQYLGSLGLLAPGADQGSMGTLLVTFRNLDTTRGWEGTVQARTYRRILEPDPLRGTVGFSSPASLFFESAHSSLVGTIRDTKSAPTVAGAVRANVGIRNTDINFTNRNADVDLSFYDVATGRLVGNRIPILNVIPGELRMVMDVWSAAGIPNSVTSVIAFADARNASSTSPTIEGFVTIEDRDSKDAAFSEMKCTDVSTCGN